MPKQAEGGVHAFDEWNQRLSLNILNIGTLWLGLHPSKCTSFVFGAFWAAEVLAVHILNRARLHHSTRGRRPVREKSVSVL